jgi:thioredoxin reductase (NADPH)
MTEPPLTTDVAIVGAGPAGLFAVFELGMLQLGSVLIDALDVVGGQCTALYPEKPIYDIPAQPEITAGALVARLEEQIAPFAPGRLLGQRAETLEGEVGNFTLRMDRGGVVKCKAVIVAAGGGAFGPNRPPLDRLAEFEAGGGVRYFVREREELRGKRVVIAGGGDAAVDWALALSGVAASVSLVHRRARFRAAPQSAAKLAAAAAKGEIALVTPFQLHGLDGKDGVLAAVEVVDPDGRQRRLDADVLLACFGLAADLGPLAGWGLQLSGHQIAVAPASGATSRPGVFAIGDVASYPGKLKLILQGFAEAAIAAHAIYPLVRPAQPLHFAYSTSLGRPGAA